MVREQIRYKIILAESNNNLDMLFLSVFLSKSQQNKRFVFVPAKILKNFENFSFSIAILSYCFILVQYLHLELDNKGKNTSISTFPAQYKSSLIKLDTKN